MRERPPFLFSPFLGARHTGSVFNSPGVTLSLCPSIPNPVVSNKKYGSQKPTVRMKKVTVCSGLSMLEKKKKKQLSLTFLLLSWLFWTTHFQNFLEKLIYFFEMQTPDLVDGRNSLSSFGVWTEPLQWSVRSFGSGAFCLSFHPDSQPNLTCYLGEMTCLLHASVSSFVKMQMVVVPAS